MKYGNFEEDNEDVFYLRQIVYNHKKPSEWSLQSSKYSFLQATTNKSLTNLLQNDDHVINKSLTSMQILIQNIQARTKETSYSLKKMLQSYDQNGDSKLVQKQKCQKSSNLTKRTISTQRSKKCVKYLNLKNMIQECEQNNKNQFYFERESTPIFENQESLLKSHFQVDENQNFIKSNCKQIQNYTPVRTQQDIWTIENQTILQQLDQNFQSRMNENFEKKVLKHKKKAKTQNQQFNYYLNHQQKCDLENTSSSKQRSTQRNSKDLRQNFVPKGVYQQILSSYSTARLIAMKITK